MGHLDEIELLAATPDGLRRLTSYLDAAQWRWKPSDDSWSCLEVVAHLRDIELELYGVWARRGPTEDRPVFAARYDAAGLARERRYNELDPAVVLDAFRAAREETVASLRRAPGAAWDRPWVDRDGAEWPLRVLLRRFGNHDAIHFGQMAKVKRAQHAY